MHSLVIVIVVGRGQVGTIDPPNCPHGPEDPLHNPLACDSHCICAIVAFWHHNVRHVMVEHDHMLKTADVDVVRGGGGTQTTPN